MEKSIDYSEESTEDMPSPQKTISQEPLSHTTPVPKSTRSSKSLGRVSERCPGIGALTSTPSDSDNRPGLGITGLDPKVFPSPLISFHFILLLVCPFGQEQLITLILTTSLHDPDCCQVFLIQAGEAQWHSEHSQTQLLLFSFPNLSSWKEGNHNSFLPKLSSPVLSSVHHPYMPSHSQMLAGGFLLFPALLFQVTLYAKCFLFWFCNNRQQQRFQS